MPAYVPPAMRGASTSDAPAGWITDEDGRVGKGVGGYGGKSGGKGGKGGGKGGKGGGGDGDKGQCQLPLPNVPRAYWGRVIGSGGKTLQSLKDEFGVTVRVPRPDAPDDTHIILIGASQQCQACADRIMHLVQEMSRPAEKQKVPKKAIKDQPYPDRCGVCDSALASMVSVYAHLRSRKHHAAVCSQVIQGSLSLDPEDMDSLGPVQSVVRLLSDADVAEWHEAMGFNVVKLLDEAPALEESFRAAQRLQEEISEVEGDVDWLQVTERWRCAWDGTPSPTQGKRQLQTAASIEEILERIAVDESPPRIRQLQLPAQLAKADPRQRKEREAKARHMWPHEPGSCRLAIGMLRCKGRALEDYHIIAGTSFIKALSGDNARCKDTYYLQKHRTTLCCLHVPSRSHSQEDAGHAVENLLCGSSGSKTFCSCSSLRIGDYHCLIASEVDAVNSQDELVEVKSSGKNVGTGIPDDKAALQVACNGSQGVLCCTLDGAKTTLQRTDWLSAQDLKETHKRSLISSGQRVRLLLDRIYNQVSDATSGQETSGVLEMTFDHIRAPIIRQASADVSVMPGGSMREL